MVQSDQHTPLDPAKELMAVLAEVSHENEHLSTRFAMGIEYLSHLLRTAAKLLQQVVDERNAYRKALIHYVHQRIDDKEKAELEARSREVLEHGGLPFDDIIQELEASRPAGARNAQAS